MARKTIRIDIPTGSADDLIALAEDIISKNTALGPAAELDGSIVSDMVNKASQAKIKRDKADRLAAEAKTLNEQAATLLGTAPGQTALTEGTVLFHITGFRDTLLTKHRGNEEALSEYGFATVVGTAKTPGARKKKV